jgi:hypothetical protein
MKRQGAASVLLTGALVLVGCGGGGANGRGTTTTAGGPTVSSTTVPAGPTTTNPGTDPVLTAKAKAAVLQPGDFPAGFSPQPDEPGAGLNLEQLWAELLGCLGVAPGGRPSGIATSPTYLRQLATQGRSTVEYRDEASAGSIAAALTGPKALACLNQVFTTDVDRSKPEGSTAGPATVARQDVPGAAQKSLRWRINASVHLDELVVPLFQDFEVVIDRGTVIRTMFLNTGSEFPQELERTLVQKILSRA